MQWTANTNPAWKHFLKFTLHKAVLYLEITIYSYTPPEGWEKSDRVRVPLNKELKRGARGDKGTTTSSVQSAKYSLQNAGGKGQSNIGGEETCGHMVQTGRSP